MKKIIATVMTTAILITAFAGCGKETTAETSENTTNEVTKVTSGNALVIPTDEEIEISYDFLKDSADIFSNWKKA